MLTGGKGRDVLFGNAGRDVFDFNSVKDSVKGSNRDKIRDFKHSQKDKIDVSDIAIKGKSKFKFIGDEEFSGKAGELRFDKKIVQGDTNGDGKADFEISVNVGNLVKGDFIL